MGELKDVLSVVHHAKEVADGLHENNSVKTAFNSFLLGVDIGNIMFGNSNSSQSPFNQYLDACKYAVGRDNPFVIDVEKRFKDANEREIELELQQTIASIECYQLQKGISTDIPLLTLMKRRYSGAISQVDFDNGIEIVKQIDIENILLANADQSIEYRANILEAYNKFADYTFRTVKDELYRRGQLI